MGCEADEGPRAEALLQCLPSNVCVVLFMKLSMKCIGNLRLLCRATLAMVGPVPERLKPSGASAMFISRCALSCAPSTLMQRTPASCACSNACIVLDAYTGQATASLSLHTATFEPIGLCLLNLMLRMQRCTVHARR